MYKNCNKCKEQKLVSEFSKDSSRKDGYGNKCKVCIKEYQQTNKERIASHRMDYCQQNKEKIAAQYKEYCKLNRDKVAAKDAAYAKNNPDKVNTKNAKRRATRLQAMPKWLTEDDFKTIESFYKEANQLQLINNEQYHVDHIVPLQGKNVCGLHVPWNLRVIPAKENLSKSNKLQEEIL